MRFKATARRTRCVCARCCPHSRRSSRACARPRRFGRAPTRSLTATTTSRSAPISSRSPTARPATVCGASIATSSRPPEPVNVDAALRRSLLAEFLGSAFLAAVVIGSGIAAQRLSPGDVGLELFENAVATGAGLYTIILMFGPVSGAHFNPVVSLVDASFGGLSWRRGFASLPAQVGGCVAGAITANAMFATAAVSISTKHRASGAHLFAELIATLGLLLVIFSLARTKRAASTPAAVGAYIGAAYFFTSSASFANPAIAVGRMFSDTFAGIAPAAVPGFVIAQLVGGLAAIVVLRTLYPDVTPADAADVLLPPPAARRRRPAK